MSNQNDPPAALRAARILALLAALCTAGPLGAQSLSLARATLTVSDVEASLVFYRDLLGMQVAADAEYDTPAMRSMFRIPEGSAARLVLLDAPPAQARALALVGAPGLQVDAQANRSHAPALVFRTDDLASVDARLRAAGTPVIAAPRPLVDFRGQPYGQEAMYLDPDGVRIVLMQPVQP